MCELGVRQKVRASSQQFVLWPERGRERGRERKKRKGLDDSFLRCTRIVWKFDCSRVGCPLDLIIIEMKTYLYHLSICSAAHVSYTSCSFHSNFSIFHTQRTNLLHTHRHTHTPRTDTRPGNGAICMRCSSLHCITHTPHGPIEPKHNTNNHLQHVRSTWCEPHATTARRHGSV